MECCAASEQPVQEEEECCWICLQPESAVLGPLEQPCACPRYCHIKCLSRWQLQSAGRREETNCRFCNAAYSDWKQNFTPPLGPDSGTPKRPATPIMAIFFEGQTHRIKVYPGPEGKARFEQQIRELIQLDDDEEFDISFECKAPDSGTLLHLDGMNAFDAATHCAALTAAERLSKQAQKKQQQQQQQLSQEQQPQEPLQHRHGSFDAASLPVGLTAAQQQQCPGAQHLSNHDQSMDEAASSPFEPR